MSWQPPKCLDALVPRPCTDECDHTLHITDAQGNRRGSWADEYIGFRWRVVCRCCGRFYGYHPDGYEPESPESTVEQTSPTEKKRRAIVDNTTTPLKRTPTSYHTSPRQREPVLVVLNADGYVEVYAERHIDVHIATRPDTKSAEGEQLADEYMELCLPPRYREVYWPINLRATQMVRTITPEDIAWHEWQLEMLQSISNAGRVLRSDDEEEGQQIWVL